MMKVTLSVSSLVWLVVLGCSTASNPPSSNDRQAVQTATEAVSAATGIAAYKLGTPPTDGLEIASRARRVAEVVSGRSLPQEPFTNSYAAAKRRGPVWADAPVPDLGTLHVAYDTETDDVKVFDTALDDVPSAAGIDVVPSAKARATFLARLSVIEAAGLANLGDYDMTRVVEGFTDFGSGAINENAPPQILNHKFKVYRKLGGLPVRNSFIRVAVHRGGGISSVHMRGTALRFDVGSTRVPILSDDGCAKRFAADFPIGVAEERSIGYVLPMQPTADATLEPKCFVSYVEVQREGALSRRKEARYSLFDDSPPEILGGASGDPGPADKKP